MNETQLLCTFTTVDELDKTVEEIKKAYTLAFDKIYLLENIEDSDQLVLTYNVNKTSKVVKNPPASTISVHRKKQTNTIYTINAINKLIEEKIGKLDKTYKVDWDELQNSVLVTAYGKLKVVNTKLVDILNID